MCTYAPLIRTPYTRSTGLLQGCNNLVSFCYNSFPSTVTCKILLHHLAVHTWILGKVSRLVIGLFPISFKIKATSCPMAKLNPAALAIEYTSAMQFCVLTTYYLEKVSKLTWYLLCYTVYFDLFLLTCSSVYRVMLNLTLKNWIQHK